MCIGNIDIAISLSIIKNTSNSSNRQIFSYRNEYINCDLLRGTIFSLYLAYFYLYTSQYLIKFLNVNIQNKIDTSAIQSPQVNSYSIKLIQKIISVMKSHLIKTQNKNLQIQQLHDGIFLRKRIVDTQQHAYIFELEVHDLTMIDFEADFTGSENISIKGVGQNVTCILKTVQPRVITPIATVQLHEGWKLKTVFRFLRRAISKDKQIMFIKPQIDIVESQKRSNQALLKNEEISLMPYDKINLILAQSKLKFIDRSFPPQESSILGRADKGLIDDTVNHWRRPDQIFQGKNYSLIQQIDYKNLKMGKLLDHAFYSVIITLAISHSSLIQRLFLHDRTVNQNGIYSLRICKNGEWQKVIIDDYIPCQPLSKPKFTFSGLNQIWIPLLQKAYAKTHKKYISLHQLQVSNVLNDLIGCPTMILDINSEDMKEIIIKNMTQGNIVVLYDIEEKQFDEDNFVALKNYAYPLIEYEEEDGKIYFKFISHTLKIDQIAHDTIQKVFKYICICKVQNWDEVRIKGKFVSIDAGNKQNPYNITMSRWYYSVQLQQKSEIYLCLHQEDLLIGNNSLYKKYHYISIIVFQKGEKSKLLTVPFKKYAHNRQLLLSLSLLPGIYLIVPIINEEYRRKKPISQLDEVSDIFRKLDLLMRRELKYADLEPFYKVVNEYYDNAKFDQLLKQYAKDRKGLGFQAFLRMWEKNKIYWEEPATQYYAKQKLFVLSIHSKNQISVLIKSNIGTEFNNKAHCEMLKKYGKKFELQIPNSNYVKITYMECKSTVIQYMVENIFQRKIQVLLDCSEFLDYEFVPASGRISCELDSGQSKFMMKIKPKKKNDLKKGDRKQIIKVRVVQ